MADIFVSYAHEDEARVGHLVEALEEQGWSVFWDRRIPAGETWRSYIGQALGDAHCVMVVWSRSSVASNWVIEEADEGLQRKILVPVLLDSILPPIGFRSVQAADLADWQPGRHSPHFHRLVQDIRAVLGTTAPTPGMARRDDPKSDGTRRMPNPSLRQLKLRSRPLTYGFAAVLIALVTGTGYWGLQEWRAHLAGTIPPSSGGLVFATRIAANGQALDPAVTFPPTVTKLYAVFRPDMVPPGMKVYNVQQPAPGGYYANLQLKEGASLSRLGWRWYRDRQVVIHDKFECGPGQYVWLERYDNGGVFRGELGPGKYTVVVLVDEEPVMSAVLTIKP
jgi:TIR domain-containing protein